MTNLQELIEIAHNLSLSLEKAANEEIKFCIDIQMRLENLSWELLRTSNELKEIKYYAGI